MQRHTYGPELVKMRVHAKLTQGEVAKNLRLSSPQFVSNWERGNAKVPVETVRKLSGIYKVKPDALVNIMAVDFKKKLVSAVAKVAKAKTTKTKVKAKSKKSTKTTAKKKAKKK